MNPGTDPPFVVGVELVEFDRRGRPIYDTTPGELAGRAEPAWGVSLDRLYGDEAGLHVEAAAGVAPTDFAATAGDPLVELGNLTDALDEAALVAMVPDGLPALDPDFALAGAMALPDGGLPDGASLDWTYDGPA